MTGPKVQERPRALLIGGAGFVGRHLARRLGARFEVTATGRGHDIRDSSVIRALVAQVRPSAVVNLAALTTVKETLDDPVAAEAVAVVGLANLLGALSEGGFAGRLLQISSSEVYGHPTPDALPLTEASPPEPRNPYAHAKLAAEALCGDWIGRMDIVVARPFTHIGPGQSDRFAVANWARQLAEIEAGSRAPELQVGALDATRDLTDVRDVAAAYDVLLSAGRRGAVYNVCSGIETPMRQVLEALISLSGQSVRLVSDPARMRTAEQQRLRGDHALLSTDTGWSPTVSLTQTLSDVLRDAKGRVRQEAKTA